MIKIKLLAVFLILLGEHSFADSNVMAKTYEALCTQSAQFDPSVAGISIDRITHQATVLTGAPLLKQPLVGEKEHVVKSESDDLTERLYTSENIFLYINLTDKKGFLAFRENGTWKTYSHLTCDIQDFTPLSGDLHPFGNGDTQ